MTRDITDQDRENASPHHVDALVARIEQFLRDDSHGHKSQKKAPAVRPGPVIQGG